MTYANLKSIIGKRFDDPITQEFRNRYVNKMILDNDRPVFLHNETDQLFIEELIAYQFQNAKQQASATAGEKVKDVVITVSISIHGLIHCLTHSLLLFPMLGYTICKSI